MEPMFRRARSRQMGDRRGWVNPTYDAGHQLHPLRERERVAMGDFFEERTGNGDRAQAAGDERG